MTVDYVALAVEAGQLEPWSPEAFDGVYVAVEDALAGVVADEEQR